MHYINLPDFTQADVLEKLEQATQLLIECDIDSITEYAWDSEKNKFKKLDDKDFTDENIKTRRANWNKSLKDGNKVWSLVKPWLEKLNHNKCWFCDGECDQAEYDVEHFRPKKGITQNHTPLMYPASHHKNGMPLRGYWWLAFDITNYRLSCQYCNRGNSEASISYGKKNDFPLENESSRVLKPDDDLSVEKPLLLDPINSNDTKLLTYLSSGYASPCAIAINLTEPNILDKKPISFEEINHNQQTLIKRNQELFQPDIDALIHAGRTKVIGQFQTESAYTRPTYTINLLGLNSRNKPTKRAQHWQEILQKISIVEKYSHQQNEQLNGIINDLKNSIRNDVSNVIHESHPYVKYYITQLKVLKDLPWICDLIPPDFID
jgi:hypothetical protein